MDKLIKELSKFFILQCIKMTNEALSITLFIDTNTDYYRIVPILLNFGVKQIKAKNKLISFSSNNTKVNIKCVKKQINIY